MKIKISHLQFSYGTRPVLNISDTEFEQGNIYGIVGKNGVGKTTFFKALTNIITNYKGSVKIDGIEVKENLKALSKVGIVLDDMELYKSRTGLFNMRYFGGLRTGFDESQAVALAKELEIANFLDKKVSTYSLGMKKKLILLISIMNNAEILIFDEPFRGLDAKSVNWFKKYLLELKNQGRMILISSHVHEDIEAMCDKVFVMSNGDFRNTFDLKDRAQYFIYKVEVSDKTAFTDLLSAKNISYEMLETLIKFELDEVQYKDLFKDAVAQGIEFMQIKKENKFVELIK